MPLKKLPPEMSYAALREAHPPKKSEREPAAKNSEQRETSDAEKPTEPAPQASPAEMVKAAESVSGDVAKGGLASNDGEPRSEGQGGEGNRPPDPTPPQQTAKGHTTKQRARPTTVKTGQPDQVLLRGYVPIPAKGAFASFDELSTLYGERKALGLALTASLKEYGKAASEGKTLPVPSDYTSLTSVEVGRTVPASTIEAARVALDPWGLLGSYQLGGLIFKAALGRYLMKG